MPDLESPLLVESLPTRECLKQPHLWLIWILDILDRLPPHEAIRMVAVLENQTACLLHFCRFPGNEQLASNERIGSIAAND
jgi:hypothetical protein